MRGIISAAGYVPYRRLSRGDIAAFMGSGGGKGTRAVASHDEDTTTLGFEAARLALRGAVGRTPDSLWFATTQPAYLDKTNATAVAAALRLPGDVGPSTSAAPSVRAWAPWSPRWVAGGRRSSWRPTPATGCRRAVTRRRAAMPARRSSWETARA